MSKLWSIVVIVDIKTMTFVAKKKLKKKAGVLKFQVSLWNEMEVGWQNWLSFINDLEDGVVLVVESDIQRNNLEAK